MLDLRRIRVGIEVDGVAKFYEGMRVRASGTKYANPLQNDCSVVISGLNQQARDYILTETSPFNSNRSPKRLIVEVGRVSTGLMRLFVGDIVSAEPGPPPDLNLHIKAMTQNAQAGNVIAKSGGAQSKLSDIAKSIAQDLGLALAFEAQDKNIANYQFTGGALKQVQKLADAGAVNAYIDDASLIVKDYGKPLAGRVRVLNKDSGMVGIPKPTEHGVKVSFLIDNETALGGLLRIDSKLNKALNGDYSITQLSFDVASHDDPFFYTASATRL